jgi:hypothetical protein
VSGQKTRAEDRTMLIMVVVSLLLYLALQRLEGAEFGSILLAIHYYLRFLQYKPVAQYYTIQNYGNAPTAMVCICANRKAEMGFVFVA